MIKIMKTFITKKGRHQTFPHETIKTLWAFYFIQFISLTKFLPLVFTYSPGILHESKFGKFIAFSKGNYNHLYFLFQQNS